ncbi:MAG: WGR domain-containing protein [Pseudomonadota bacterium]|nr:WGR domain-containing protein [Pseudomonadota bacterium]
MRVYMQIPALEDKPPRFYHLILQKDLLEGWSLVREWGFQGSGGRVKREHYGNRDAAEAALIAGRDAQVQRGYRVVFVQGQQASEAD